LTTWVLSLAVILGGVSAAIRRAGQGKAFLAAILVAFALQFALYWLPGFPLLRERFEAHFKRRNLTFAVGLMLLAPYAIYGAGTGAWSAAALLKLVAILSTVLGIYALAPPKSQKLSWQDALVLLLIAAPAYGGWYQNVWPAPVYLDVMARLFFVPLAAFAVLSVRRLADVGYVWRLEAGDWVEGVKQLVLFSVVGLPLGFGLGFIAWHPRNEGLPELAFSFVGIFLFIAVAEELFFRGVLQNLLEKSLANKYAARGIASAVFGLSHIQHGFPNWRYVLMAAIAGWFYGTAWHKRKSIVASSVTHAAIDTLWRHFLHV
jgi:hypothetical protein